MCNGMWESVWIARQLKDAPAIEVARRVTYKRSTLFRFYIFGSYSFFAAIVQREHRAVDLSRPVLWICDSEGECIPDRTNDCGEIRSMCIQKVWRKKQFVTIESQDSCLISFVRSIVSSARNNELLWIIGHKQTAQRSAWYRR